MTKAKLLSFILTPLFIFLASFAALVFFFSQQSGHILWENLVGSAVLAALLAFFAFLCTLSRWALAVWLVGTLLFIGIGHLGYSFGGTSSPCYVSFYCLDHHVSSWQAILIQSPFEAIFFIDIIFGFRLGVLTLIALSAAYPQTKYFMGTFITGLFTVLLSLTQRIPEVPKYNSFQYSILFLMGLAALVSLCFAIFYKKLGSHVDQFKRIYGAAVLSFIPLMITLVPFDVSTAEAAKEAFIARVGFSLVALFIFVYLGFFAKLRSTAPSRK
jgi:hypothetical protein